MTCQVCQRDFGLSDFIRFIQQWAQNCSDPGSTPGQLPTGLGDSSDDPESQRRLAASLLRHLAPSIRDRENLKLRDLSPTPSTASSGSSFERKELARKSEEGDEERKKNPVVDAGANTNESGENINVCSFAFLQCTEAYNCCPLLLLANA